MHPRKQLLRRQIRQSEAQRTNEPRRYRAEMPFNDLRENVAFRVNARHELHEHGAAPGTVRETESRIEEGLENLLERRRASRRAVALIEQHQPLPIDRFSPAEDH